MTFHIDHRGVAFRLYVQGDGSLKGLNYWTSFHIVDMQ